MALAVGTSGSAQRIGRTYGDMQFSVGLESEVAGALVKRQVRNRSKNARPPNFPLHVHVLVSFLREGRAICRYNGGIGGNNLIHGRKAIDGDA